MTTPTTKSAGWSTRRLRAAVGRRLKQVPELVPLLGSPTPSLVAAAADLGWATDDEARAAFISDLAGGLDAKPDADVAVIVGAHPSGVHIAIARAYPRAAVRVLDTSLSAAALHVRLSAAGPFDLVVDDTRHGDQHVRILHDVFFHLRAGGALVVRDYRSELDSRRRHDGGESLLTHLSAVLDDRHVGMLGRSTARRDRIRLARSIGRVVVGERHLEVTNEVTALAKLRDDELNSLLKLRRDIGRVIESVPGAEIDARDCLGEGADRRDAHRPLRITAPAVHLREYNDVICAPGQVVVSQNLLLPDSYRHSRYPRLSNRWTRELAPRFAQGPRLDDTSGGVLEGAYFWMDCEWRGHFGHVMTDQLPRMWAWKRAKQEYPELKALLSLAYIHDELPSWQVELLGAAGIAEEDLVILTEPVRVERLLAATSMLSMPSYIHPGVVDVWDSIRASMYARRPPTERAYSSRIFVSRRPSLRRHCHNTAELEKYFEAHGFEVIYPGEMTLSDQVESFRRADVIAGFTGSGLFSLMYCDEPKHVIISTPTSFRSSNEYLIAAARGHRIDEIWSASDLDQPAGGWTLAAYESSYTFDFDVEGRILDRVLADVDNAPPGRHQ